MSYSDIVMEKGKKYMENFHNNARAKFLCVHAYFDDIHENIVDIPMSDVVLII